LTANQAIAGLWAEQFALPKVDVCYQLCIVPGLAQQIGVGALFNK
jgi:hypothetical protein